MTNGTSGRKKESNVRKKQRKALIPLIAIMLIFLVGTIYETYFEKETLDRNISNTSRTTTDVKGELMLTMIDVGQADSFLLEQNGEIALIDCGTRSTGKDVVEYLQNEGINNIDYLFGTHPHDDHMGGMYDVITNFNIGKIILPEVEANEVTTNWYIELMTEIKDGKYNLEYAKEGTNYHLGDATMKILGPISEPESNLNNYSTVLKVSFGQMDIIMTGDAESVVEQDLLEKYQKELDAEILKVGHHGSDTSTSDEFLEAVSPEYALISAKIGNKYEHPIKSIMQKLEDENVEVYRTDENGTVEVTITTDDVTFSCEPGDYLSGTELEERKIIQ